MFLIQKSTWLTSVVYFSCLSPLSFGFTPSENPQKEVDEIKIVQWIEQLSNPAFKIRENATQNLIQSSHQSVKHVLSEIQKKPSLEVGTRLLQILEEICCSPTSQKVNILKVLKNVIQNQPTLSERAFQTIVRLAKNQDAELSRDALLKLGELTLSAQKEVSLRAHNILNSKFRLIMYEARKWGVQTNENPVAIFFQRLPEIKTLYFTKTQTYLLTHIKNLAKLETLSLDKCRIRGHELTQLEQLPNLKVLSLKSTLINDQDLKHLQRFQQLKVLQLSNTNMTNLGLFFISKLKNLEELNLAQTKVNNQGLKYLASLVKLQRLDIADTEVSAQGFEQLKALPVLKFVGFGDQNFDHRVFKKILPNCQLAFTAKCGFKFQRK